LIDMLNKNVHLDGRTKTAIKVFDDLEILNKDVDLIKKDPENFIYDYFAKEKNKIDLKRETLFAKINDISDKMIDKIKQMEIDSKSNLKEKQNLIDSNFDYKKLTGQVLEWKEEIRNPQLNNDRLEKIIDESSDLLKQMENQSFEAKNKILNEKGCYFSPNKDEFKSDLFGELIIDNFSITDMHEKQNYSIVNIVNNVQTFELVKLCEFDIKKELKLLYRASRDGFKAENFHSKCDNIPKTLTIIKVKDKPHIFGGYTEATWEGNDICKEDPNAFIFSLVNDDNKPIKMKIPNQNIQNAIYCHPFIGPTFSGFGGDFNISSDSNTNEFSRSTYQHPNYQLGSNEAQNFLAGSCNFSTSEIEVYQVV
jgi:hypothetical protein